MKIKYYYIAVFLVFLTQYCSALPYPASLIEPYNKAFDSIARLAQENLPNTFKKAVFLTENTYSNNTIDYEKQHIVFEALFKMTTIWRQYNSIPDYTSSDSLQMNLNSSIFHVIKDTFKIQSKEEIISLLPFEYNFDDYNGKKNWSNTFVSTLLETHKGNCHSLPYLYKILADESGAKCWLALAPNHMYIKNYSKRDGWFNTELTSGEFPIDAWLTTTGYISLKAIQSGLYCDTLSNQQSIALCAIDLAKCYEKQTRNYYDGFILKCCDLVLKYHSVNVQALLLKAETLKQIYGKQTKDKSNEAMNTYDQMEQLYIHLYDLGYREMPEKMYKEWLLTLQEQKDKYGDKQRKE